MINGQPEVEITWLAPLFTNAGGADVTVGVTSDDRWFLTFDSVIPLTPDTIHPALLPLLQDGFGGGFHTVHELVCDRLVSAGLCSASVDTFPFLAPVRTAFSGSSAFWVDLAAEWLGYVSYEEPFARTLLTLTDDKALSQDVRHLIRRHLHEWEAENGLSLVRANS